jgi:imidazolonepropionase-like amidohydrolase
MYKTGLFLMILAMLLTAAPAENLVAIKAGKVFPVSGPAIDDAVVLIRGDRIEKIGKNIAIPSTYSVIEYNDCHLYPGLINSMTTLGISGISMVREWNDTREDGKYVPQVSAFTAFYPWSNLIVNTRDFGTLIAVSAPAGGQISGKACLVKLHGWAPDDMFIKKEVALVVRLPESKRGGGQETEAKKPDLSKDKQELEKYISRARNYYLSGLKGNAPDFNAQFEALKDLWENKLPVIIQASSDKDIKFAIQLGRDFELNVILYGIYDGEKVLDEIEKSAYPVILDSMYQTNKDWEDGCDKVFRLPAALAEKGIPFAFSVNSAATAFDLPIQAGRSVAYGLSQEEALKALTLYPAKILGIPEYGSLEPGKMADFVVTSGNILETSTVVKDVFIAGKKVEGKSFFRKEYERTLHKISGEVK